MEIFIATVIKMPFIWVQTDIEDHHHDLYYCVIQIEEDHVVRDVCLVNCYVSLIAATLVLKLMAI